MAIQTFTDATFAEQVEHSQDVALVDFWAPWCLPCRAVGPRIEKLAEEFAGRAYVGRLNVDEQPQTAARYHIKGIPTVAIFQHGRLVNTLIGIRPEQVYRQALQAALQPAPAPASKAPPPAKARGHQVTVFSTPTCPWCARLKAYLQQHQVSFRDIDVSRDARAAQDMVHRSGQIGVPQAWIDGQVVVGFDRKRVNELLGLPAA